MVSYKIRPGKWIWGLIPLALPFLGAHFLNSPVMVNKLSQSARVNLKSSGSEEINLAFNGRDVVLTGQAESREAIDNAILAVTGTYGVRQVDAGGIQLVRPVVLDVPTVTPGAGRNAQPEVKGTWPEGIATTLSVQVGGKNYVLGQNKELTSDGKGNWSLKPSMAMADGKYDVAVSTTDGKRAAAIDSSKNELVIDTTPPVAPAISTKLVTKQTRPTISGTWANKEAGSLAITLAGKEFVLGKDKALKVDGNGNWTLAPPADLADGTYDVSVKTADKLGNVSTANVTAALTIDTTAPAAPAITTKLVTKRSRPTVSGTWANKDAKSLTVKFAGKEYVLGKDKALTVDGNGKWTLTPAADLADGTYDVMVKTADEIGNVSTSSVVGALKIDTTAPTAGTVVVSQGTNLKPVITGTWSNAVGNTLVVGVGRKNYRLGKDKALTADSKGNWTLKLNKPLASGKHEITVTTADALGNEKSVAVPGAVEVDNIPPASPEVTSAVNATTAPVFKGTWAEKAGNTLKVFVAGKVFALGRNKQLTSDGKGNWTLSLTEPLNDGKYPILVESADALGNLARSKKPVLVAVDTTKPDQPTINALSTRSKTPKITGTWPQNEQNKLNVTFNGKNYAFGKDAEITSDGKGNWSLMPTGALADGSYGVTATVTDQAGNKSLAENTQALAIDSTGPAAPTVLSVATKSSTPSLSGTWDASDSAEMSVSVAGKTYSSATAGEITQTGNNWSLKLAAPLKDGEYDVTTQASDKFGNKTAATASKAIVIDTTPPQTPTVTTVLTREHQPTITGTWDSSDTVNLLVSAAGQSYSTSAGEITQTGNNWSLKLAAPLKDGEYDVTTQASDKLGNKTTATASKAIVIDTTPPQTPTVTTVLTRERQPTITGTWDSSDAVSLRVSAAGQNYNNAKAGEIEINGDHWSITPRTPIKDGVYDVVAIVSDKLGNNSKDAGNGELAIDGTSPATPTVRPLFGTNQRPTITGTWEDDGQNSLSIRLAGKSYSLSKKGPLTSDGKGGWKLVLNDYLPVGSYDVKIKVADRLGNQSNDISNGEIWIKAEKKPEPPKPVVVENTPQLVPTPTSPSKIKTVNTCQKDFTVVLAGQSINFKTSKVTIASDSKELIARLATIAQTCLDAKVIVSGHTDSRGSASFNKSLSEGRASAVVDALVARGVAKSRLRAVGYGEDRPIADNKTKQGMAKNRRIEFRVEQ